MIISWLLWREFLATEDEIELKFNSSFNNQLKYTQNSESPEAKIRAILGILDIKIISKTERVEQKDIYYDTQNREILQNKNSLRIRNIDGKLPEITSKHFISSNYGQFHRIEDSEVISSDDYCTALLENVKKYFPELTIQTKPVVTVINNRIFFNIKTKKAIYQFCLDKFYFTSEDGARSDDFYEIEIEHDSSKKVKKKDDPQLKKLSIIFRDVIGFTETEKNKYEKGVDWIMNPINEKNMQFILFDVVEYSRNLLQKQKSIMQVFTKIIADVLIEYHETDCKKISIGYGVILCLKDTSTNVIKLVKSVIEKLKTQNDKSTDTKFTIRTAINYGSVLEYQDINNYLNLAGKGINIVSRMLREIEEEQILISNDFYKKYKENGIISEKLSGPDYFSEPYSINVKKDSIDVRNFYIKEEGIGIPHTNIY